MQDALLLGWGKCALYQMSFQFIIYFLLIVTLYVLCNVLFR